MNFAVVTLAPNNIPTAQGFNEVSDAFHHALLRLGHSSKQSTNVAFTDAVNLMLGAHNLGPEEHLPDNVVLVNLEQLENNPLLKTHYFDRLLRHRVWDYSAANVRYLKTLGAKNVTHVPIGYVPELTRIPSADSQDIDVLFYGTVNRRRWVILDRLDEAGVRVETLFRVYGSVRDSYIARSRIVLNIHCYETKIFEVVRVSYLLANRAFVVSEPGEDAAESQRFEGGIAYAEYDRIVDTCVRYLSDPTARRVIAQRGYELMCGYSQADYLRPAIAAMA